MVPRLISSTALIFDVYKCQHEIEDVLWLAFSDMCDLCLCDL